MKDCAIDPGLIEDPYPLQELLGFYITAWGEGHSRFELPLTGKLMNRYGIPHGGIYATMLDVAMGYSGSYTGDPKTRKLAMTLSMTTNFVAQPKGEVLIAEGRRVGGGRKTFFAEARILDAEGNLCATGTGTFRTRGTG